MSNKPKRQRWYLGGPAGAGAVMFTHPLDLLKVHLQQAKTTNRGLISTALKVIKNDGFLGLYGGISASILRQLTYNTTRFALYERLSAKLLENRNDALPFYQKLAIGCVSGFVAGVVGNPADMVLTRMQNDVRLPKDMRRNYKHGFDGIYRVVVEERFHTLFAGVTMTATRGLFMTLGQVATYDQTKQILIMTGYFKDNVPTHVLGSFFAGTIATSITQPFDVIKTRMMNAKPGEYQGIYHCAKDISKDGIFKGLYRGFVPRWIRLGPHTILTWVFLEQLRKAFPLKND